MATRSSSTPVVSLRPEYAAFQRLRAQAAQRLDARGRVRRSTAAARSSFRSGPSSARPFIMRRPAEPAAEPSRGRQGGSGIRARRRWHSTWTTMCSSRRGCWCVTTTGWQALPYVWNETQDEAYLESPVTCAASTGRPRGGERIALCRTGCQSVRRLPHAGSQRKTAADRWAHAPGSSTDYRIPLGSATSSSTGRQGLLRAADGAPRRACVGPRPVTRRRSNAPRPISMPIARTATTRAVQRILRPASGYRCPVDRLYGVCKTPVAVGRGSGDRPYDIYPGRPEDSILRYRMEHSDPAIAMPELGRSTVHREARRAGPRLDRRPCQATARHGFCNHSCQCRSELG